MTMQIDKKNINQNKNRNIKTYRSVNYLGSAIFKFEYIIQTNCRSFAISTYNVSWKCGKLHSRTQKVNKLFVRKLSPWNLHTYFTSIFVFCFFFLVCVLRVKINMYNTLYAEKPDDHRSTQLLIHSLLIAITTLLLLFRYLTIFRWFGYLQWENWWTATALFDRNFSHSLHFDTFAISELQNLTFCCEWKTLLNVNRFVQWLSWCTY